MWRNSNNYPPVAQKTPMFRSGLSSSQIVAGIETNAAYLTKAERACERILLTNKPFAHEEKQYVVE